MQLLRDNPILLLFLVLALGQVLGRLQMFGFSLGVAAVLFVGLAFGAWDAGLKLPDFVYTFGLTLFVYTMGISSGPGFFTSFRQKGLRENALVFSVILIAGFLTMGLGRLFQFEGVFAAGLFSGALTNTPALAAVLDTLKASGADEAGMAAPVVAYSLAYPGGVIGMMLAVFFAAKWFDPHSAQKVSAPHQRPAEPMLESWVVAVNRKGTIRELREVGALHVSFARIKRQGTMRIATDDTDVQPGDFISIVGQRACLEDAEKFLGKRCEEELDRDRSTIDFRRIFVSQKTVTEMPLSRLDLGAKFGAVITRVRRGDVEFVPDRDTVLEPGDRVRVVAARPRMEEIASYLGDSYRALSEIDVVTFSLGIALGLLLGRLPLPLPQGGTFELGFAGGPLIVGLILGRIGRSGPFVWTLPYSANLTLRQLGMVLFLAGVGIRSGHAFATTLQQGGGIWTMVLSGALVTLLFAALIFIVGGLIFKLPFPRLAGIMAGAQTQPAVLGYALEQSGDDQPNMAYATVYPVAMLTKIAFVQIILSGW